jgi:biotin carboxylase
MPQHAVIVDPYSAATEYGPAFRSRGVSPIAVLSTPAPLDAFTSAWHPEEFDRTHTFRGSVTDLVATLRAYDPVCVIPGIESGVELAEALAGELTPGAGNDPATTASRRDKWAMAGALARAGVPVLRQTCANDPDQVRDWLDGTGLRGSRLIMKPPKSGGTDDVHVVEPDEDWRPCFDRLLGAVNRFGIRNAGVLVQEFAPGEEYVVDTYSVDGKHGVVEVCRYTKRRSGNRIGIYDRTDFVPPDDPAVAPLTDYVFRVADAVGLRNGCGHAEVILTPAGPRLIEIAARLAGNPLPLGGRLATGDSQVERTLRHRLDGQFTADYGWVQHVRIFSISTARAGILRNVELLEAARDLPTARAAYLPHRSGERVAATTDLFTALGWVLLAAADRRALDTDYLLLKELEGRLEVEAAPVAPHSPPPSR